jgi:anti-sigma-K factor RskA
MPHIESMIDDYVLNLLPPRERAHLEHHVASCSHCLGALNAERGRTSELITTLKEISAPTDQRLERIWLELADTSDLFRKSATSRQRATWDLQWRRAFAGVALAILLLIGTLGSLQRFEAWIFRTDIPATASLTASPTATLTPTWTKLSSSPESFALAHPMGMEEKPVATGTPETHVEVYTPEPLFNPQAPSASGH